MNPMLLAMLLGAGPPPLSAADTMEGLGAETGQILGDLANLEAADRYGASGLPGSEAWNDEAKADALYVYGTEASPHVCGWILSAVRTIRAEAEGQGYHATSLAYLDGLIKTGE